MAENGNPNNRDPFEVQNIFPGPHKSPVIGAATLDPDDTEPQPPPMETSGADIERTMLTDADLVAPSPQAPVASTRPACKECTCKDGVCPCTDNKG